MTCEIAHVPVAADVVNVAVLHDRITSQHLDNHQKLYPIIIIPKTPTNKLIHNIKQTKKLNTKKSRNIKKKKNIRTKVTKNATLIVPYRLIVTKSSLLTLVILITTLLLA